MVHGGHDRGDVDSMILVIRRRLTLAEAAVVQDAAYEFFKRNPRRRVFRVGCGDGDGVWFTVRKNHVDIDIANHTEMK